MLQVTQLQILFFSPLSCNCTLTHTKPKKTGGQTRTLHSKGVSSSRPCLFCCCCCCFQGISGLEKGANGANNISSQKGQLQSQKESFARRVGFCCTNMKAIITAASEWVNTQATVSFWGVIIWNAHLWSLIKCWEKPSGHYAWHCDNKCLWF